MDPLEGQETYKYDPLPAKGWIRLLEIEPSDEPSTPIVCRLTRHRFVDNPVYEALSYTWGDEEGRVPVEIDGQSFFVRANLHAALRMLRQVRCGGKRLVWVDAVCINQRDAEERSQQVWQMDAIYAKAVEVVVWLGEAAERSDQGMDLLQKLVDTLSPAWDEIGAVDVEASESIPAFRSVYLASWLEYAPFYEPVLSLLQDEDTAQDIDAAVRLLRRPWWRRIWTLQESVMCRRTICYCGSRSVAVGAFHFLSYVVLNAVKAGIWKGTTLDSSVELRTAWRIAGLQHHIQRYGAVPLITALDMSQMRQATDPRDKILGLLGLLGRRSDLEVNYSMSAERIYRAAFRAMLYEQKSPVCLGMQVERPEIRNPALPSWIPDFSIHFKRDEIYVSSLSKPTFSPDTYDASRWNSKAGRADAPFSIEEEDSVLMAPGIVLDTVHQVGSKAPGFAVGDFGIPEDHGRTWAEAMHRVVREWRSFVPRGKDAVYGPTGEPMGLAFWRTLLTDLQHSAETRDLQVQGIKRLEPKSMEWVASLDGDDETNGSQAEGHSPSNAQQKLLRAWGNACEPEFRHIRNLEQLNRRFFTTSKEGYIGLGPPSLRAGDVVCILFGGSVAYALRRKQNGLEPVEQWTYVGECYLHGVMDGEAVEAMEQGKLKSSVFQIF